MQNSSFHSAHNGRFLLLLVARCGSLRSETMARCEKNETNCLRNCFVSARFPVLICSLPSYETSAFHPSTLSLLPFPSRISRFAFEKPTTFQLAPILPLTQATFHSLDNEFHNAFLHSQSSFFTALSAHALPASDAVIVNLRHIVPQSCDLESV